MTSYLSTFLSGYSLSTLPNCEGCQVEHWAAPRLDVWAQFVTHSIPLTRQQMGQAQTESHGVQYEWYSLFV